MFEDLRDYLSKLCFWRLPTTEATITRLEIDQVTRRILVHYRFFVGEDGPYAGVDVAEGLPLPGVKDLDVGQTITVRYRQKDPSINMLNRDPTLTPDL